MLQRYPEGAGITQAQYVQTPEYRHEYDEWLAGKDEPTDADMLCYARRYPDLEGAFGLDLAALRHHWTTSGRIEKRNPFCKASKRSGTRKAAAAVTGARRLGGIGARGPSGAS